MELELHGWKVKAALVAVAVVVIAAPFVRATMANKSRAEDWHHRAVVAEESVTGLRVVIAERSRALNQRTLQANRLVSELQSNGSALRRSKVSVGTLTRRQRQLAAEKARVESERRSLRTRLATLESIGSKLDACVKSSASTKGKRTVAARRESCSRVSASFAAYLERSR
jgi:hypothetical protein